MGQDEKPSVKYRIKSYHYDPSSKAPQLVFTIEELGRLGELRQYAHEITAYTDWQDAFSTDDIAKINFAIESENEE